MDDQSRPPHHLNSFTKRINLDWSKLKVFADDKILLAKFMIFVLIGLKTLCEKEKMLFFFSLGR